MPPTATTTGNTIQVTITPATGQHAGCTTSATAQIDLGQVGTTATTFSGTATGLVDIPAGQITRCQYVAAFPAEHDNIADTLRFRRTGAATAPLAKRVVATSAYLVEREAFLTLVTNTTATHTPTTRGNVSVTVAVAQGTTCAGTAPAGSPFAVNDGAAALELRLPAAVCTWEFTFTNPDDDCRVEAQLKGTEGNNAATTTLSTVTNATGALTVYVDSDRRVQTAASGGSEIGSIDL